jgi:hypothetical protein
VVKKTDAEVYRMALRTIGSLVLHGCLVRWPEATVQVGRTTNGFWLASVSYE